LVKIPSKIGKKWEEGAFRLIFTMQLDTKYSTFVDNNNINSTVVKPLIKKNSKGKYIGKFES